MKPHPEGYLIKLVRDNTREILNPSGIPGDLWYEEIKGTNAQYQRLLKLKLSEEVGEYLCDGTINELLDVLAVIEALGVQHGKTLEQMIVTLGESSRGGFLEGIGMYGKHSEYDR